MRKHIRARLRSRIRQAVNNPSIQLRDSISYTSNKYGRWDPVVVTFQFDKPYRCSQFATGEWWVCPDTPGGTVTITGITPNQEVVGGKIMNGAMLDVRSNTNKQAFEDGLSSGGWDASLLVSYPLVVSASSGPRSITKGASYTDWEDYNEGMVNPSTGKVGDGLHKPLRYAAILTVLNEPLENSHLYFRPSYLGQNTNTECKHIFSVDDINTSIFPGLTVTQGVASQLVSTVNNYNFESLAKAWCCAKLDYYTDWTGRYIHPGENWQGHSNVYGSEVSNLITYAISSLCFDKFNYGQINQKRTLWGILQYAIDLRAGILDGQRWYSNGGHLSGRKLPLLLAEKCFNQDGPKFRDAIETNEGTTIVQISNAVHSLDGSVHVLTLTCNSHGLGDMQVAKIINASNTNFNGYFTVKKIIDSNTVEVWPWNQTNPGAWGTGSMHEVNLFQEDNDTYYSWATGTKKALWGAQGTGLGQGSYYEELYRGAGSRTVRDPYGLIDGGSPGYSSDYPWIGPQSNSYQLCCTGNQYKYAATIARLLKLDTSWEYTPFFDYVDRVFTTGIEAYDTLAPYDETVILTINSSAGIQVGDRITKLYNATGTVTGLVTQVISGTSIKVNPYRYYNGSTQDGVNTPNGTYFVYRGATFSNGIVSGGTLVSTITVSNRTLSLGLTYGIATTTDNGNVIGQLIQGPGRVPANHNKRASMIVASIDNDIMTVTEHYGAPISLNTSYNGSSTNTGFTITATNTQNSGYTGTGGTGTYKVSTPTGTSISNKKFFSSSFGYGYGSLEAIFNYERTLDPRFISFVGHLNKTQSETITSEWVKVGAIGSSKTISIIGGINSYYRVSSTGTDEPAWTQTAGVISSNQWVQVMADSSDQELTLSTTTINIDGFSNYFSITTGYFVQYQKIESEIETYTINVRTVSSMSWANDILTITTSSAHGFLAGQRVWLNVTSGTTSLNTAASSDGYLILSVDANTINVSVVGDPGALTVTTGRVSGCAISGGNLKVGGGLTGTILVKSIFPGASNGLSSSGHQITASGTSSNGIVSYPITNSGFSFPTADIIGFNQVRGQASGSVLMTRSTTVSVVNDVTYNINNITVSQDGLSGYYNLLIETTANHNLSLEDPVFIHGITPSTFNSTDGAFSRVVEVISPTIIRIRRSSNPGTYTSGGVLYPPTRKIHINSFQSGYGACIIPGTILSPNGGADAAIFGRKISAYGTLGTTGTGGTGTYALNRPIASRTVNIIVDFLAQGCASRYTLLGMRYKQKNTTDVLFSADASANTRLWDGSTVQAYGSSTIKYQHNNGLSPNTATTTRWVFIDMGNPDKTIQPRDAFFDGVNKVYGLANSAGYYIGQRVTFSAGLTGSGVVTDVDTYSAGSFTITATDLTNPTYTGPVTFTVAHDRRGVIVPTGPKTADITGIDCTNLYKYMRISRRTFTVGSSSWTNGVGTINTTIQHNIQAGDIIVISGASPVGWNGTFTVNSTPTTNSFTITVADPAGNTTTGSVNSNGAFGGETYIKSINAGANTISVECASAPTAGTIYPILTFGAIVQWWEQGNIFQKSTSHQFSTYIWNRDILPGSEDDTLDRFGNDIFNNFLAISTGRQDPGAAIFEFAWADWDNNLNNLPDISEISQRSKFRASNIGPFGEIINNRQPKIFWTGTAAEFNTNGIENKGSILCWERPVFAATSNTLEESGITLGTGNVFAGWFLRIISGTGSGQLRKIVSNTNTTFTLDTNWSVIPDATSAYRLEVGRNFRNVGALIAY